MKEVDKEKNKAYYKEYYKKNKEKIIEKNKAYQELNKEYYKELWKRANKEYGKSHREIRNKQNNEYRKKYSEKYNEKQRDRYKNDISFKIKKRLRTRMYAAVTKKYGKTLDFLGCSIDDFLNHLKKQFQEGMNFENIGEWHIDHIRPCASFNLLLEEEQKQCFHYTNLQPLWAEENIRKQDKYEGKNIDE